MEVIHRFLRPLRHAALMVLLLVLPVCSASAQNFRKANSETRVSKVSFKFVDRRTFDESRLREQIATTAPGFWALVQKILPFTSPKPHLLDPVELQKDVKRLELFYNKNGFLHPEIDYAASQLDTARNAIHVIFTIEEGPPVIIQDVGFYGADREYAVYQFPEELRPAWTDFRERTTVHTGERYTEFDRLRIRDEVLTWLQNRGFAFARVESNARVDTTANTADLTYLIDAGPRARIDSILVEGNVSVDREVILRELPFVEGQLFSRRKLAQAQQELFSLSLFRLALTDVPEQPRDSTVSVLVRVREADLRYVNAQTGYGREGGVNVEGEWTHRNFLGAARTLTVSVLANTGAFASPSTTDLPSRLFRVGVNLLQPYLFNRSLSGSINPFIEFEANPLFEPSNEIFGVNSRAFGVNTSVLYEIYPFRTATFRHTFSQILQRSTVLVEEEESIRNPYDRSVFSANAILGKVDDFLNPSNGFLFRPIVEYSSGVIGSSIDYYKVSGRVTAFRSLTDRFHLAGRMEAGRLWPTGESKDILFGNAGLIESIRYENRFDPVMFYAGGSNDLRGWGDNQAGPKTARRRIITIDEEAQDTTFSYYYEPAGGMAQLATNVELRFPAPGLGSAWHGAAFLDVGFLGERSFDFSSAIAGTGVGIRYQTLFGFLRIDLAYKLTPSYEDLRNPREVYLYRNGLTDERPSTSWRRRFNLHINIGQAF